MQWVVDSGQMACTAGRWRAQRADGVHSGQMACTADAVDEVIVRDFKTMQSGQFIHKYRDLLTKFAAHLHRTGTNTNTLRNILYGVKSFFNYEAMAIKLPNGMIPGVQMAVGEHRFDQEELRRMWLVADIEGKARLSTAVSLGWSVGDFSRLETQAMYHTQRIYYEVKLASIQSPT